MQKLQDVLNDKESMQQIQELASMLTGGTDTPQTSGGAESQGAASQALSAMSALSGGEGSAPFDIGKLMQLQGAVSAAGKSDKNIALLMALRPLLRDENQVKLDRIVRMFRLLALLPLLRESGLLGGDLFG